MPRRAVVALAALAARARAACDVANGSGVVYVYSTGAARSLENTVAGFERLFCADAGWAGGRSVVPLLHVWANSSCRTAPNASAPAMRGGAPRPFAAAVTDATMPSMDEELRAVVERGADDTFFLARGVTSARQNFGEDGVEAAPRRG